MFLFTVLFLKEICMRNKELRFKKGTTKERVCEALVNVCKR